MFLIAELKGTQSFGTINNAANIAASHSLKVHDLDALLFLAGRAHS